MRCRRLGREKLWRKNSDVSWYLDVDTLRGFQDLSGDVQRRWMDGCKSRDLRREVRTRCTNMGDEYTAEVSSLKTR